MSGNKEKSFSTLAKNIEKSALKKSQLEERESYEEIQRNARKKALEFQEAKDNASNSTGVLKKYINDNTGYVVNFSDLHAPEGNMLAFMENLKKFAAIPNCYFVFGGDQINNSIKGSVGDTHSEIMTPREQVRVIADIIKEVASDYPDVIDRIWAIVSGNHENRTFKNVSEDPAYWLAEELEIKDAYIKNIAVIEVNVVKDVEEAKQNKNEKDLTKKEILDHLKTLSGQSQIEDFIKAHKVETVITKWLVAHAEQVSGNPAAQADHALSSKIDSSIDVATYGHNHNIGVGTERKEQANSRGKIREKEIIYVNFGSYSNSSEYAERALYPPQKQTGTQIIRIANIGGNRNVIDVLDAQNLLPEYAQERIDNVIREFQEISQTEFETKGQMDRAFTQAIKKAYKKNTASFKKDKEIREEYYAKSEIPKNIYFAPLGGATIGKDDNKLAIKQLKEVVSVLSKIDEGVKITLTDLVYYKKALTIIDKSKNSLGEKFPEESFSYILQAAEILRPVKDKIVAYFNGEQEEKIMRYHREDLAKMATNRLQMSDKLCYEPYDEEKMHMEKIKFQAQQVEKHNKQVLNKEVEKAYKDLEKTIIDSLPFMIDGYIRMTVEEKQEAFKKVINKYESLPEGLEITKSGKVKYNSSKNAKLDYLKHILSYRLRGEGKLLSLSDDKVLIDHKFPLGDIELREPHRYLIQNIFAHVLGIDAKQLLANDKANISKTFVLPVQDERGRTRNIVFSGTSSKSKAGRRAIHNNLQAEGKKLSGAHIYYINTKSGKEFLTMNVQKDGKKIIDNVYISAGGLGRNDKGEATANKVYKISAKSAKNVKKKSRGIYANLEKDFDLLCEILNYETIMLKDDVFSKAIKSISKQSYEKAYEAIKEREEERDKITYFTLLDQEFEKMDEEERQKTSPKTKNSLKEKSAPQTTKNDREIV